MENRNSKGPIAGSYADLQGLPNLERAAKSYLTEKSSFWSLIKVLLQTTEVGTQNLNDLLRRLINDLNYNLLERAAIKLGWIKDINHLLIRINNLSDLILNDVLYDGCSSSFPIDSQTKLESSFKELDVSLQQYIRTNSIDLIEVLETQNLTNGFYRFLHDYRILAYELTLWSKNLQKYRIPADSTYSEFIGLKHITAAVNEPSLTGDTFFTQFRCLHQIPELITVEANNRLESATVNIRNAENEAAHKHLRVANELLTITLDSFKPIVDNLSQNDYHEIRENLGLTSGSHSVNIHFQLFRDLYTSITTEFVTRYFADEQKYQATIIKNYPLKLIETELLRLRNLVEQWRNFHLHLPRINLGEHKTKSLIGSSEAVEAARKMQQTAQARDHMNKLVNVYFPTNEEVKSDLVPYIISEESFDSALGSELGKITQNRFKAVQDRQGVFSDPVKFKTPPKRRV